MKTNSISTGLAVTLLLLCAWPRTSVAQAAIADSVLAWGLNDYGQTTAPFAAQSGVTAIAAGWVHTVALRNDGSVVAWGGNDTGETTVPVAAQSGVTAVAAGGGHTVALKNDGAVVAWGLNDYGQTTIPLAAQSGVSAIAAGSRHTVALKNDGSIVAWGQNISGETTVPVAAQSGVTAIAAGEYYTVALKADGTVVAWGRNDWGQTTVPVAAQSGVTAIAAGWRHTVALKADGTVVAWGKNDLGQTTVPVAAQSGVMAIAAGWDHTVALKNDGSIAAWGNNGFGQGTVPVAAQSGVSAIAAGSRHTVALVIPTAPSITTQPVGQAVNLGQSASFTVVATGYPLNYQWRKDGVDLPGATSATYSLLPFAHANHAGNYTVVVSNSVGSETSAPPAALTVSAAPGAVVAWGTNDRGQLTVPIAAQSGVTAIAVGGICGFGCIAHTVALKNDGTVVAWGHNGSGQVTGTPTTDDAHSAIASPATLGGQVLSGVIAIAAGGAHTVALKNDGTVVAWGQNWYGQVTGIPTTDDAHSAIASPVTLGGQVLSGVIAIAAGGAHTVALKNDGTVVAWGQNWYGQVTGTQTEFNSAIASPVTLEGHVLSGVTAIAAGWGHTVALKNDGSVVAWGWNPYDQTTVPVAAQSGVRAIAAGEAHTVALKNDGSVAAWGYDYHGQVTGTPTIDEPRFGIASPVTLGGQLLRGVTAIAAGNLHTVALKNDGSVVAWGSNGNGQVTGTPTTDEPSQIANPVTLGGEVLGGVTAIAAGPSQTVALIGGVKLLPSLKARPNGNELILSWPTNAVGFTLQSTLDLKPPVTWLDSTNVPAVIGAQFTLTNTTSGGARFYRLRKM